MFSKAFKQFDVTYRLKSQHLRIWFIPSKVTIYNIVDSVHKISTGGYNEQVRKMSLLLRAGGGAKKGADLVELFFHSRLKFLNILLSNMRHFKRVFIFKDKISQDNFSQDERITISRNDLTKN